MLNTASIQAVNASRFDQGFVKPLYDSYCFANVAPTIRALLTGAQAPALPPDALGGLIRPGQPYDAVVLLMVDGFGWRFFERYVDQQPFLKRLMETGVASKMTSMFPSTTAAHVTDIHTGLVPAQSGVYEWLIYDPALDRTVTPLLFSWAGDKVRETMLNDGVPAAHLFPQASFYQQLAGDHVRSMVFQNAAYARGAVSDRLCAGADIVGFKSLAQGVVQLGKAIANRQGPTYYYFYWSDIDSTCHEFGPNAAEFEAEVDLFFTALERQLAPRLAGQRVLLMLTADHGQVEVEPTRCRYLNLELPKLMPLLQRNTRGEPIMPSGGPRDTFWHVQPAALVEAREMVRAHLQGRALVVETQTLVDQEFFGPRPTPVFLSRLGNLAVLPYAGESVWWWERDKFELRFWGHHGGLTPQEMEIPLLVAEFE